MSSSYIHTVLIVDDEEPIIKALSRMLKDLNVNLLSANCGDDALDLIKSNNVSLIISDHRMPGMTGVELLGEAKKISPHTIRILITGYADIDATINAINTGEIKYYINKPWDDEFLISRVKESLELFEIRAENEKLAKILAVQNKKLKDLNDSLEDKVKYQTREIVLKHKELSGRFLETIKSFSTIIGLRHKDIASHSLRVANLVEKMIKGLEIDDKARQDIIISAYLHDIGKIVIPDSLMKKSTINYSKADWVEIRRHPILGQTCVSQIGGFEQIGEIIRHHHENYDGSGYPDNIKEERIPLGSRIIRVIDGFDNFAHKDTNSNQNKTKEAAANLVKNSGDAFDPSIVKMFIDCNIVDSFVLLGSYDTIVIKPSALSPGMKVAADVFSGNGMFLLPRGATLSIGMIKRIQKINSLDKIPGGIKIRKEIQSGGKKNGSKIQHIAG